MSNAIAAFQKRYMSYGSWLSEWLYGFIMVAVVTGMLNGFSGIDPQLFRAELTLWLVIVTFGVNITWGLIDGLTVIYGGLTDKADQEKLIGQLKKDRNNPELRGRLMDLLGDTVADYLSDENKEALLDRIIDEGPEHKKRYTLTKEDRRILLATASCDILAVIPVILPFIVLGFVPLALTLSRLIAAIAIGFIVYRYAEHTGRRKWLAAGIFFVLTLIMMVVTFYFGW
jgi:hypothetical protein